MLLLLVSRTIGSMATSYTFRYSPLSYLFFSAGVGTDVNNWMSARLHICARAQLLCAAIRAGESGGRSRSAWRTLTRMRCSAMAKPLLVCA